MSYGPAAYLAGFVLVPVIVAAVGGRMCGFRREWQILMLSYVFLPIVLLAIELNRVRPLMVGDTLRIPPFWYLSYAWDISAMFAVPVLFTWLRARAVRYRNR